MKSPESSRRSGILAVITLFTTLSVTLLGAAWYACSLAPEMMLKNYRSVRYVAEMQSALTAIYLGAANGQEPKADEIQRFESNLAGEKRNITEAGEPEAVLSVERQWAQFGHAATPTVENFQQLSKTLEELTRMNEKAMYAYEETALTLSKSVLFGGLLSFSLVFVYAIQIWLRQDAN